ncbi:hypothetical protein PFMALIP_06003, partial [Plasmodium falciparum MaliPS096_E11]
TPKVVKIENADKLLDKLKKENGKVTGEEEGKYHYEKVTLENSGTQGPRTSQSQASGDNTPLTDFISRPTYFRYLEEWGETFCRQRTRMLEQLEKVCRSGETGKEHCSGDGHYCKTSDLKHHKMFQDFVCRDCHKQCRKYRKWIDIKFVEFHNQRDKYKGEHKKLTNNSNGGGDNKEFCKKIQNQSTTAEFLKALKHCKDDQGGEEKDEDKKNNKIDFDNPLQTFSRSTYCKTCPLNGVTCNGGRGKNGCTEFKKNGETWAKVFEGISRNGGKSSTIEVEMIDHRAPYMKDKQENSKNSFKISRLFKGISKQQWTCKFNKDKNMDVCKLDEFKEKIDLNKYTTFKVFVEYWIQDFIESYYILKKKKKIEQCTKNGENTCDEDSKNDCVCVKEWVDQKSTEWKEIQKHFNNPEQEYGQGNDIKSKVRNFLETLIPRMNLTNGKEKISDLDAFLKAYACNGTDSSQKDIIECLLNNLQNEITSCQNPETSGQQPPQPCDKHPSPSDDETSTLDNDYPDNDHDIQKPAFCPAEDIPEKPKVPESDLPREDKLNTCPYDNDTCNNYLNKKNIGCLRKQHHTDLNHWKNTLIKFGKRKSAYMNDGIFVPPRRRQLCFRNIRPVYRRIKSEETFTEYFLADVYNEAIQLSRYYGTDHKQILEEMKYSFADYGDIVKGTDMLDDGVSNKIKNIFEQKIKKPNNLTSSEQNITPTVWWEQNKIQVWYAMLCGYKAEKGNFEKSDCSLPDDKAPQFLRWFQEWGKAFCTTKKKLKKEVETQCKNVTCNKDTGKTNNKCTQACKKYSNFISGKQNVYELLKSQYDNNYKKNNTGGREAHDYLKITCKDGKCDCIVQNFSDDKKWEKPYETLGENLKSICECITKETTCPEDTYQVEKEEIESDAVHPPAATDENNSDATKPEEITPKRDELAPKSELPPLPEYDPTNDILKSTIPVAIALALGSIAFLFIK